jgi:hypothetical protein
MKFCFVLTGESFRRGGQRSRLRGTNDTFTPQMTACQSHMNFIKYMKDTRKWDCDVVINTMSTPYDKDLANVYTPYVVAQSFHTALPGYGENSLSMKIGYMIENIDQYDFVFIARIDLCFKSQLKTAFPQNVTEKIYYPSVCFLLNNSNKQDRCCPRVSDTMFLLPRKYFHILTSDVSYMGHDGWCRLHHLSSIPQTDLDVIVKTFHDSDTYKDWNPLYRIVGRPETKNWYSKGFEFDMSDRSVKSAENHKMYDGVD